MRFEENITPAKNPEILKNCVTIRDRFEVPYRLYGDRGPVLVCINGVAQSMVVWMSVVERISPFMRVLTFDFPGQGKSKILSGSPKIELSENLESMEAVIDHAAPGEKVMFLSASFGAVVASLYAQKHRERVSKQILASLSIKPCEYLKEGQRQLIALIDEGDRKKVAHKIVELGGSYLSENFKKRIMMQFMRLPKEQLESFKEHMLWLISYDPEKNSPFEFEKIEAETLIAVGKNDPILDKDDLLMVGSSIRNCSIKVLKNTSHFMHFEENREDLIDMYLDFYLNRSKKIIYH